jgi:hypothetical protein
VNTPSSHTHDATRRLAHAFDLPFVDLDEYEISPGMLRKLPARLSIEERCVPMMDNPRRTVLVVDDVARIPWLELRRQELGIGLGKQLEFALGSCDGLNAALCRRLEIPDLG